MRRLLGLLGRYWLTIGVATVGLMSGITSIVREWLSTFYPGLIETKPLFDACLRTSFLLACVWTTVVLSRRLLALDRSLQVEREKAGRPKVILQYRPLRTDRYTIPYHERVDLYVISTSDIDAYEVWFDKVQFGGYSINVKTYVPRLPARVELPIEYVILDANDSINLEFKGNLAELLKQHASNLKDDLEVPFLLQYLDFHRKSYRTEQVLRYVSGINADVPWFDLR